jgi:hypothetical protein
VLNERADEEMEVSDTEEDYMGNLKKKSRIDSSEDRANLAVIKVRVLSFACTWCDHDQKLNMSCVVICLLGNLQHILLYCIRLFVS